MNPKLKPGGFWVKFLSIILVLGIFAGTLPNITLTASAATVNPTDNKAFNMIAYNNSVKIEISMISGAVKWISIIQW